MASTTEAREHVINLVCRIENVPASFSTNTAIYTPPRLQVLSNCASGTFGHLFASGDIHALSSDLPSIFGKAFGNTKRLPDNIVADINSTQKLGLCVRLLASAQKRLGRVDKSPFLRLHLLELEQLDYESRISLAIVKLTIAKDQQFSSVEITAELIQEVIFALSHSTKDDGSFYEGLLFWSVDIADNPSDSRNGKETSIAFSLKSLIEYVSLRRVLTNRFMHFSALGLGAKSTLDQRKNIANSLAHRASLDYNPGESSAFSTYDNVVFAASIGGVAVVVDQSSPDNNFVQEFIGKRWVEAYEPMVLHNLHSFFWVHSMCERESNVATRLDESYFQALDELLKDALRYRLRFRFSNIGFVSPQRTFHEKLRLALELPGLESELMADVSEVRQDLIQRRQDAVVRRENQARRDWVWLSVILAVCGAIVVTQEIMHAIVAFLYDDRLQLLAARVVSNAEATKEFQIVASTKHQLEIGGFFISIVLGVLAGLGAKRIGATDAISGPK